MSNIKRIVHGDPRNKNSRRDLTGISPKEFSHMVESLQAGLRDALVLLQLSDSEIRNVLKGYESLSKQFGFQSIDLSGTEIKDFRNHQKERIEVLTDILYEMNQPYPAYDQEEILNKLKQESRPDWAIKLDEEIRNGKR